MAILGYLRVSTDDQNIQNQKLAIFEYCSKNNLTVDHWIEATVSSRKDTKQRKIDYLLESLTKGDTLIVAELSRLGRSVGQIAIIVDSLINSKITLIALKENMILNGKLNIQDKVTICMFSLFAEIERDLISERTKEGLVRARHEGKKLGRPKGPGKSRLDGKEREIKDLLSKKVSKAALAKIYGMSYPAISNFIHSRELS